MPYIRRMFDIATLGDRWDRGGFRGVGCASNQLVPSNDWAILAGETLVRLNRGPHYLLVGGVSALSNRSYGFARAYRTVWPCL
jgi:hypothetical protein